MEACQFLLSQKIPSDIVENVIIPFLFACSTCKTVLTKKELHKIRKLNLDCLVCTRCFVRCIHVGVNECPWIGPSFQFIEGLCINHYVLREQQRNSDSDIVHTKLPVVCVDCRLSVSQALPDIQSHRPSKLQCRSCYIKMWDRFSYTCVSCSRDIRRCTGSAAQLSKKCYACYTMGRFQILGKRKSSG